MSTTKRRTSPGAESLMFVEHKVLDHGRIVLVDYMGDDESIEQAARTSYTNSGTRTHEKRGLIRYLMRHRHTTPFEMAEIKLEIDLPLFVAAQWVRHRTANINSASGRYAKMRDEFYFPDPEQLCAQSITNKQGRAKELSPVTKAKIYDTLVNLALTSYKTYESFLEDGLTRELARVGLPQNLYTTWVWKCDLHNLFHFLALRMDHHAQWEIRQYANTINSIVQQWVPIAHEAFVDYRFEAVYLSRMEAEIVRRALAATSPDQLGDALAGLTKREQDEFKNKLWRSQ